MLPELLEKDCPFKPYQFLEAYLILEWLLKNVEDPDLEKLWVSVPLEKVSNYLFNYFYAKSGLKPLSKCSTAELEAELEKRKHNEHNN